MKESTTAASKSLFVVLLAIACLWILVYAGLRDPKPLTLKQFYYGHRTERGMWKYDHYLEAYQRHLAPLAGRPLALAEVGVQSGGSIPLWRSILGSGCHYYGIDINPASTMFADDTTTILVGDQGDGRLWDRFFNRSVAALDVLIDDGSHLAHDMLLTLTRGFPHMNAGGILAVEDFHNPAFADWVLCPAAKLLGTWSSHRQVASVHLYPFLLVVRKAGPAIGSPPASFDVARVETVVGSFAALRQSIARHPGGLIALENVSWGSFFAEDRLCSVFQEFRLLNQWDASFIPAGCGANDGGACTISVADSPDQSSILGVHVSPTRLVVEVAAKPPLIEGVRVGTEWVKWYHNGTGQPPVVQAGTSGVLTPTSLEPVRRASPLPRKALARGGPERGNLQAVELGPTGSVGPPLRVGAK